MFYLSLFLTLTILAVIALAGILILLACRVFSQMRKKANSRQLILLKKTLIFSP